MSGVWAFAMSVWAFAMRVWANTIRFLCNSMDDLYIVDNQRVMVKVLRTVSI